MKNHYFVSVLKPIFYYTLAAFFLLFEMGVQSSPNVMSTQLMSDLQVGSGALGLAVGFYFVSYTFMQIPVGLLFDRFSPKPILTVATLLCSLGAFLFSIIPSLPLLALARFIMGLGSSFAFVGVLVVANDWFLPRRFALLVGIAQLLAAVGAAIGSVFLEHWVSELGWRHLYLSFAVVGFVLSLILLLFMRNKEDKAPVQLSGVDLSHALKSISTILRHRQALWIVVYAFTAWAPITIFPEFWGTAYLKLKLHNSALNVSYYIYYIWGALALFSPFYGWLSDFVGRRVVFLKLSSLIGLVGFLLLQWLPSLAPGGVIYAMLSIGVAAAAQILTFALIRDNFPKQDLAVAIGIVNMGVVMGGFIFQPLTGLILQGYGAVTHHSHPSLAGFNWALSVIPLVYLLGWWVSTFRIKDV